MSYVFPKNLQSLLEHKVYQVWVIVSQDGDNEGIMGAMHNGTWFPFVCGDEDTVPKMVALCSNAMKNMPKDMRHIKCSLVKFTNREVLQEVTDETDAP